MACMPQDQGYPGDDFLSIGRRQGLGGSQVDLLKDEGGAFGFSHSNGQAESRARVRAGFSEPDVLGHAGGVSFGGGGKLVAWLETSARSSTNPATPPCLS